MSIKLFRYRKEGKIQMDIKTRMTNISELPPLHQKNAETFRNFDSTNLN